MDQAAQSDVIEFLERPETYGFGVDHVRRIDTHGAVVFLAGERAYKLKRAVRYSYLDYSTLEKRRAACEAELALNRRTAPSLYLSVEPVCRDPQGRLRIGSGGAPADWLVVMRRFDEDGLLDRLAERGGLDRPLMLSLAARIVAFHRSAERNPSLGGHAAAREVLEGDIANLRRGVPDILDRDAVEDFAGRAGAALETIGDLLDRRRAAGRVRRCHGDLHLRNICLIDGVPTLFDCIEFSDRIACIDVVYDLAFLLMDLDRRDARDLANAVLNRYLDLGGDGEEALGLLPQFLSQRAAIRAHVAVAAVAAQPDPAGRPAKAASARAYLTAALDYLSPEPARLVAVGGLSGTGKSTLAYGLAPVLGAAPGARVLRTDVIRKRQAGLPPEARLPPDAYGPQTAQRVYEELVSRAAEGLHAGHAVIADAVFARPEERAAIEAVARDVGVSFAGVWLEAPAELLEARIAARRGDASDATVEVVRQQQRYELGAIGWRRLDVSGDPGSCLTAARAALGRPRARATG